MRAYIVVCILLSTAFPLILNAYGYPLLQALLALVLFEICLYPTARYYFRAEPGLPIMSILCIAYAIQFCVPFFTRDAIFELVGAQVTNLSDSDVAAALVMAIVGVIAIQIGYYWMRNNRVRYLAPVARLPLKPTKAILFCAVVGSLFPILFNLKGIIPEEFQQPLSSTLVLLQNQVLVVIGVLGWIVYRRKKSAIFTIWLYALVVIAAVRGISTGMLEEGLVPIGTFFVIKWWYTRRIPAVPLLVTAALVLFLSPVKADYRNNVWFGGTPDAAELSTIGKARLWVEEAADYWQDTLTGSRGISEATTSATARGDLLHQVAHIYSMTPSVVPYQNGDTYSYFLVALIPRAIWPNKPATGNANNFFAVAYGVSTEEGVKTSTFGVSLLGESFINFGWFGVVLVMMVVGMVLGLLEFMFAGPQSGPGGAAVFIAFFIFFLNGIGSSAEMMFGGILQNLICGTALLWWARDNTAVSQRRSSLLPARLPAVRIPA